MGQDLLPDGRRRRHDGNAVISDQAQDRRTIIGVGPEDGAAGHQPGHPASLVRGIVRKRPEHAVAVIRRHAREAIPGAPAAKGSLVIKHRALRQAGCSRREHDVGQVIRRDRGSPLDQ